MAEELIRRRVTLPGRAVAHMLHDPLDTPQVYHDTGDLRPHVLEEIPELNRRPCTGITLVK